MKLADLFALAIPAAFFAFWALEVAVNRAGGGRRFPKVGGWAWIGIGFFLVGSAVNVILPLLLPGDFIAAHRLMNLSGLGLWGAPLAFLAASLTGYLIHRAEHRFDLLWRGFHQMHHAIERVDIPGWAVGHPLETFMLTGILSLLAVFVLGVDPMAAALASTVAGVLNMFEHLNVPTPRWLGYLIQRPEQHCLHHERGVHARNYGGDIVLWDVLFGSYANPARFEGDCGFGHSSIKALPAMFAFRDVNVTRSSSQ